MTRWIALAALALVACAGGEAAAPAVAAPPESAPAVTEATLQAPAAPACEVVFSPAPELEGVIGEAAARWSTATGCDIHLGEGGIPVLVVARDAADLFNAESGTFAPAVTIMDERGTRIEFAPDWATRATRAPMHEMGHALAQRSGVHSADPEALMYWNPTGRLITASDLELVCAILPCAEFVPEI